MYLKYPTKHISITQDYKENHTAIDLGWHEKQNDPLYACGSGVVEKIYYFTEGGNSLRIKYDNNYSSEFMHIRDNTITVKVGDRVSINQKVAEIGNTGTQTTGPHVHVIIRNEKNVRIDPKTCLYVYDDQTINTKDQDKVLYYKSIKQLLSPNEKDTTKDQIEITIDNLRIRKNPSLTGEILGYIYKGIHNYYDKKNSDNYTWYKIYDDMWIAYSDTWATIYPKSTQSPTNDCTEEITILNNKILLQTKEIEELKNKIKEFQANDNIKLIYKADKTDTYAIKIYSGERLYIKSNE